MFLLKYSQKVCFLHFYLGALNKNENLKYRIITLNFDGIFHPFNILIVSITNMFFYLC